ncbi:MAG: DUF547 domain-containing protein [Planctomycetaceae bacterium]
MQPAHAKSPLGRRQAASALVSMDQIDHAVFNTLLKKYVDSDGYVDYSSWKRSSRDRQALQYYLGQLSRADRQKRASREARMAFWINAYNAVTLEGILQEYPTSSIRKHTSRFGGYNIWKDLPLMVGNHPYSLNDMEHKILRKMGDPRIHFAIVCASVSCPRLRNEAYAAKTLNDQLSDNARDFFSRRQNLQVDVSSGTVHMSSILKWFGSDFGRTEVERLAAVRRYMPRAGQQAAANRRVRVRYLNYNWNLNDQRSKPRTALRR